MFSIVIQATAEKSNWSMYFDILMINVFCFCCSVAYAITEEAQHRELEGPSTSIPLSEMISSALPPEKKDKFDLNNVSRDSQSTSKFKSVLFDSVFFLLFFSSFFLSQSNQMNRCYTMVAVKVANQQVLQA